MKGQETSNERGEPSLRFCPIDGSELIFDYDTDPYMVYSEQYSCEVCGFDRLFDFGGLDTLKLRQEFESYYKSLSDEKKEEIRKCLEKTIREFKKGHTKKKLKKDRIDEIDNQINHLQGLKNPKEMKAYVEKEYVEAKRHLIMLENSLGR